MKKQNITKAIYFPKVSPHEVYEILMDSKKHSKLTGDKAKISREVGGKFSTFGDYAGGVNLELIPDKKIVQSWRASDWPEDHFSKITFILKSAKGGTKLTFTQTGTPDEYFDSIKQGWEDYYWTPMKEMLGGD